MHKEIKFEASENFLNRLNKLKESLSTNEQLKKDLRKQIEAFTNKFFFKEHEKTNFTNKIQLINERKYIIEQKILRINHELNYIKQKYLSNNNNANLIRLHNKHDEIEKLNDKNNSLLEKLKDIQTSYDGNYKKYLFKYEESNDNDKILNGLKKRIENLMNEKHFLDETFTFIVKNNAPSNEEFKNIVFQYKRSMDDRTCWQKKTSNWRKHMELLEDRLLFLQRKLKCIKEEINRLNFCSERQQIGSNLRSTLTNSSYIQHNIQ